MNRREFLEMIGSGSAVFAMSGCSGLFNKSDDKTRPPNIILIMADDLGYGDLSCYGNKTIKTPNIDALANGGMRFTDFHSNGPVCSPTRAALLTGRYQQRCGIETVYLAFQDQSTPGLPLSDVTFAEVLKQRGYATALFGKWHLGMPVEFNPVNHGFDEFRGFVSGNVDYHSHYDIDNKFDWWDKTTPSDESGYSTHLITKHAVDFIERNKNKPFCLYLPHEAPHFPLQGPGDPISRGPNKKIHWSQRPDDEKSTAYKEMVEEMDKGIGQITKKIAELGLSENTFVFFCSDNGAKVWDGDFNLADEISTNAPLSGGKKDLLEGGHRVPAIAYWPGKIKPGTITDQTAMSMDLFATMISIAGTKAKTNLKLDGIDLSPMLINDKKLSGRVLFWRFKNQKAVRKGPWKLIVKDGIVSLYNLKEDLAEKVDLSTKRPDVVKELSGNLVRWEKDVD